MKDAKGHGSDARGGGTIGNNNPEGKFNFAPPRADSSNALGGGGTIGNNNPEGKFNFAPPRTAADELSQGAPPSKAGPSPVHPGAAGPQYNREAVNNAIASSNRAGRRIGGKEARAIHALLKGRH